MDYQFNLKLLLAGILAGALSYWMNAYNETSLMGVHIYRIAVVSTIIISYLLASKFKFETKPIIQNMVFGFLLSVVGRIIFDTVTIDASSHNLGPIEILIIFLIVSVSATVVSKIGEINTEK